MDKIKYSSSRENKEDILLKKIFDISMEKEIGFYNNESSDDYTWFGENVDDYYVKKSKGFKLYSQVRILSEVTMEVLRLRLSKIIKDLEYKKYDSIIKLEKYYSGSKVYWCKLELEIIEK